MSDSQSYESSNVSASVLNSTVTDTQSNKEKETFENNKKVVEHFGTGHIVWIIFIFVNLALSYKCNGKLDVIHGIGSLLGPLFFIYLGVSTYNNEEKGGLFCLLSNNKVTEAVSEAVSGQSN